MKLTLTTFTTSSLLLLVIIAFSNALPIPDENDQTAALSVPESTGGEENVAKVKQTPIDEINGKSLIENNENTERNTVEEISDIVAIAADIEKVDETTLKVDDSSTRAEEKIDESKQQEESRKIDSDAVSVEDLKQLENIDESVKNEEQSNIVETKVVPAEEVVTSVVAAVVDDSEIKPQENLKSDHEKITADTVDEIVAIKSAEQSSEDVPRPVRGTVNDDAAITAAVDEKKEETIIPITADIKPEAKSAVNIDEEKKIEENTDGKSLGESIPNETPAATEIVVANEEEKLIPAENKVDATTLVNDDVTVSATTEIHEVKTDESSVVNHEELKMNKKLTETDELLDQLIAEAITGDEHPKTTNNNHNNDDVVVTERKIDNEENEAVKTTEASKQEAVSGETKKSEDDKSDKKDDKIDKIDEPMKTDKIEEPAAVKKEEIEEPVVAAVTTNEQHKPNEDDSGESKESAESSNESDKKDDSKEDSSESGEE